MSNSVSRPEPRIFRRVLLVISIVFLATVLDVFAFTASGGASSGPFSSSVHTSSSAAQRVGYGAGDPIGSIDRVRLTMDGRIEVVGWAADPRSPGAREQVHIYVTGPTGTRRGTRGIYTDELRNDVLAAYPWAGSRQGFRTTVPNSGVGANQVCVFAINVQPPQTNPRLGCRTVNVKASPPLGHVDSLKVSGGNVTIKGWSFDPARRATSIPVNIMVTDVESNSSETFGALAGSPRNDVNAAFGITGQHGFTKTAPLSPGQNRVCVYGIDGNDDETLIGACRTVESDVNDPEIPDQPAIGTTGSLPVGSAAYDIPTSNVVFVSPSGSDGADGSVNSPLKTIETAANKVAARGTIVLRAGSYHESVTLQAKPVTIQNYPNEPVWLDGSSVIGKFNREVFGWAVNGWTSEFDASPSYDFGGTDGDSPGWTFINPDYPMASHPDQVWIDDVAQQQVGSLGQLSAGTFYVDYDANKLYIGSDPAGHVVRASDIAKALSVRSANSIIRGIGVRRYAPSIPHIGAVTLEQPGIVIENVTMTDNATTGLGITATNITAKNLTVLRNGMLGIHIATADNVKLTDVISSNNNVEHFNTAPVSGGIKLGRTRGVTIDHSKFEGNEGPGVWLDVSVYDTTIVNSVFNGNANHGLFLEISAKVRVANNIISGNGDNGIKLNNTSEVSIWNNTLVGNGRPLWIAQDARRGANPDDYGHDDRQSQPDPTMPWINGPVNVRNNIFGGAISSNCLVCVEDYSNEFTAEQMKVSLEANVYQRDSPQQPSVSIVWSRGNLPPLSFNTLTDFKSSTGQEARGLALDGTRATNDDGSATSAVTDVQGSVAEPLPADIARIVGQPPGTRRLGAFQ